VLHNYLAAALRNLVRNGVYTVINILGLAAGFAATVLIALFVHDEYSYDGFFPNHDRIYLITETISPPGEPALHIAVTAADIGPSMQLDFTEVEAFTRLSPQPVSLRHGDVDDPTVVYWADPNFFRLFSMKIVAGDPNEALSRPDSLVLTRKMARRYFGGDDAVGKTLDLNRQHTMRVGAVIEDLPANSHFDIDVIGSAVTSFSQLATYDAVSADPNAIRPENVYNYVMLRPGVPVAHIADAMTGFAMRHVHGELGGRPVAQAYHFNIVPLTRIHLQPSSIADMKPPGDPLMAQTLIGIAALILAVAGSNFVSMMTARAAGRAVEVGVRKAAGATRAQIVTQFLGECLLYTGLALVLAIAAVEWLLPALNGFLERGIVFDYLRNPRLGGGIIAMWLFTGLAAGAYAALVISRFKPGVVLKGIVFLPGGSGRLRQALVIFQFGTLIALIVSTATIHRQTQYAIEDRLRLPTSQIYIARFNCPAVFKEAVPRIPGVLASTCASGSAMTYDRAGAMFESTSGRVISLRSAPVDYGFFELFAVRPLAGRLFAKDRGEDDVLRFSSRAESNPSMIINESGMRALGYATPRAAIGQYRIWSRFVIDDHGLASTPVQSSQIVGVVPDFAFGSVRTEIEPTVYYVDPGQSGLAVLKLDGARIPETLRAVQALWSQLTHSPLDGLFLSQRVNELYADIKRQSVIFSIFSAVAVVIAALGLLGLAVFTAERRTREIGLRKAMGASRWDILRFMGWQFARPVLWANLIGWPLAYLCMRRWLEGFAYHIDLSLIVFVAASALALVIALITVSGHALLVARTSPVEALRYE
jgi:putative ABC transport system permease protein